MHPHGAALAFTPRSCGFDWRQLHGTDLEEVVRRSDVAALEALLPMLQQGRLDREAGACVSNCVQLAQACQLAVEYLAHLKGAHLRLIARYQQAVQSASSWKEAARAYIAAVHEAQQAQAQLAQQHGGGAPAECVPVQQQVAAELQQQRAELELRDQQYNAALDELEAEDRRCRQFSLRQRRVAIDWRLVHSVDVQQLEASADASALEGLLELVAWGDLGAERQAGLAPANLRQLVALAQACIDYLRGCAASSGTMLGEEMRQLQADSADIPLLTTAVQEAHETLARMLRLLVKQRNAPTSPSPRAPSPPPLPSPVPTLPACIGVPVHIPPPAWQQYQQPASPPPSQLLSALLPLAGALAGQNWALRRKIDDLELDLRTESQRTQDMRHALRRVEEALRRQPAPPAAPAPAPAPPQIQIVTVPVPQQAVPGPGSPVVYSRQASGSSPGGNASPSRRRTTESWTGPDAGSPGRRIRVLLDEEGMRGEERAHSVAQLEHQVLSLKKRVLEDALARRTSRSPSRSSHGAGRLVTTSTQPEYQF